MAKAIIICGSTGSGKTSLCKYVCSKHESIQIFCKSTTRPRRKEEYDGIDYNFIDVDSFNSMNISNAFVHVKVGDYNNYLYGINGNRGQSPIFILTLRLFLFILVLLCRELPV